MDKRFTVNPFGRLDPTDQDRAQLVQLADELKQVDLNRWKKFTKSGSATMYIERRKGNPNSKLPEMLMVGPLPGTLDENMFGLVSPTIEAMRVKTSYLSDLSAAAVLATIIEPTVEEPFRSVVIKWLEIDIPGASIGIVRNRDYVYLESTGILRLKDGGQVGYHLLHSVSFPQTHELPNRVRGNMSLCGVFHQEGPDQTDCRGTGIMDPGGDMIRVMAVMGMVQATMAGLKYAYCGQMKKLAWLLEQKHVKARGRGTPVARPECVVCVKPIKGSKLGGRAARVSCAWGSVQHVQDPQEAELHHSAPGAGAAQGELLRQVSGGSHPLGHAGGCAPAVRLQETRPAKYLLLVGRFRQELVLGKHRELVLIQNRAL